MATLRTVAVFQSTTDAQKRTLIYELARAVFDGDQVQLATLRTADFKVWQARGLSVKNTSTYVKPSDGARFLDVLRDNFEIGGRTFALDSGRKDRIPPSLLEMPRTLGGPGSGNFGHEGRPGEVGGSASDGGYDPPEASFKDRGDASRRADNTTLLAENATVHANERGHLPDRERAARHKNAAAVHAKAAEHHEKAAEQATDEQARKNHLTLAKDHRGRANAHAKASGKFADIEASTRNLPASVD